MTSSWPAALSSLRSRSRGWGASFASFASFASLGSSLGRASRRLQEAAATLDVSAVAAAFRVEAAVRAAAHTAADDLDRALAGRAAKLRDPLESLEGRMLLSAQPESASAAMPTAPAFSSNPGATQKLFIDFDGHVVTNTHWNDYNAGRPIHAKPFDTDGNPFAFSGDERWRMEQIWRRVAEDYAPFDIDVTTLDPGADVLAAGSQGVRVLVTTNHDSASFGGTGEKWFPDGGGVAYEGSWRWQNDTPAWAFENILGNGDVKFVAEAVSHEAGHTFGLGHAGRDYGDGTETEYYEGHGGGATGWAPIMGVGYYRQLTQWTDGGYAGGDEGRAGDLETIASEANGIRLRADDHAGSFGDATALDVSGGAVSAEGLISTPDDRDVFAIDLAAGTLNLSVTPAGEAGGWANLDVLAELYDASGTLVFSSNPANALGAAINLAVTAGRYHLSIDGTGQGDPLGDGYSDYGSLGHYTIAGTVPAAGEPRPLVEDVSADSHRPYDLTSFGEGVRFFTDRDYVVTDAPEVLAGGTLVRTANSDKYVTDGDFLRFEVSRDSDVYVAYDARAHHLPKWLGGWEKTGERVETTDVAFDIYRRSVSAGTVSLGGNAADGALGALSNYFVIAREAAAEDGVLVAGAAKGAKAAESVFADAPAGGAIDLLEVEPDPASA